MIELQLLHYILDKKDDLLFIQVDPNWVLDAQIRSYYTLLSNYKEKYTELPSIESFKTLVNNEGIFDNIKPIADDLKLFFLDQIKDKYNKYHFFEALMGIINNSSSIEFPELVDEIQELVLNTEGHDDTIDEVEFSQYERGEAIAKLPLGLGKFDDVNGGMACSELFLLGGHRGSGKSVIALNCALHRYKMGKTSAFISIEMRKEEVANRVYSIVTGVNVKAIERNEMNDDQRILYYTKLAKFFCKSGEDMVAFLELLQKNDQRSELEKAYRSLPRKDHKFFLYDLPRCTPVNINFVANKLRRTHDLNFMVVDYLNIVKLSERDADSLDWKKQVERANILKSIARTNDVAIMSPMQITEEGTIKFAKAIEDPVDVSVLFKRSKNERNDNVLNLMTSKVRNGKEISFSLLMDEDNLRIGKLNEKS